jgi:hypothetical protein
LSFFSTREKPRKKRLASQELIHKDKKPGEKRLFAAQKEFIHKKESSKKKPFSF